MEAQTRSASALADHLAQSGKVNRVSYPGREDHPQAHIAKNQMSGGSTLVAFEVTGGKQAAFAFENALRLINISNNLGDAKSLITHPATTTHGRLTDSERAEAGITENLIRVAVGLEHIDDLREDLARGFALLA